LVGFKFNDIAPENLIQHSNANIMLIHGTADQTIPLSHARRLRNNSNGKNVELWEIKNRGHSDCHEDNEYWERTIQFFNNSFN